MGGQVEAKELELDSDEFITFHIPNQGQRKRPFTKTDEEDKPSPLSGSTIFNDPKQSPKTIGKSEPKSHPKINETNSENTSNPTASQQDGSYPTSLLYFNFHEFAVAKYELLETHKYGEYPHSLTITHFPNPYVEYQSKKYKSTRIVRIPRKYDTVEVNRYPQFSTLLPGYEAAALLEPSDQSNEGVLRNQNVFVPRGIYQSNLFGYSSISPLSNHMSLQEFEVIMNEINGYLKKAFDPFTTENILWNTMNFMTIWMIDRFVQNQSKKHLKDLSDYVDNLNKMTLKTKNLEIIDPRRSGYISLDFQIPKPVISSIQ